LRCIILCRFVDLCRHRLSGDIAHLFADVVVPFARCERLKLGFHVHRRLALEPRVNRKDERVSALVIDDVEIARALHVVFVAHWIGGVAFVTLVALPLARAYGDADKGWALFEVIESRFATQVRFSIPLAGATGLWMAWRLDLWGRFAEPAVWWMDAMVLLWALFMVIVFVIEPLAHRRVAAMAAEDPATLLLRLSRVHRVLLAGGTVTIFGAVAGAHGGIFG
jgi:uncharacterized membrane protein